MPFLNAINCPINAINLRKYYFGWLLAHQDMHKAVKVDAIVFLGRK